MKPRRRLWWIGVLVVLAGFVWGCGEGLMCMDCGVVRPLSEYLPQTSPENVINNLQVSYQRREIEEYAKLLAPEFIRKFPQADLPADMERSFWNRDEDSTATGALFGATTEVSNITMDPGAYTVDDAGRPDMPGAWRIRLTHFKLEVEHFNGTTLLVQGDIQDMYFRRGSAAAGTDSTKCYLVEWQDLGGHWAALIRGEK